jgi:enterochelin esterase-like enzyme
VLYLQDGQNLFDPRTSFIPGRTWEVREHADAAIRAGEVEPLIIVGIYNTGAAWPSTPMSATGRWAAARPRNTASPSPAKSCPSSRPQYRVRTDRGSPAWAGR